MNNDIKIILKKLLLFFIIIVCLDFVVGSILKKCYFMQKSGYDFQTTYVLNDVKSDVLILGSSRAVHHYNAPLIDSTLHLSAYNGGRDGCFMFYYDAVLQSVLKRYHPKLIVLDIIPDEFEATSNSYDRLNMLLPYYDSHPEIRSIVNLKGKYEKYKLLSRIYPYNSKLLSAVTTLLHAKQKRQDLEGYLPMYGALKTAEPEEAIANNIDTVKVAYFKKFIDGCQKAGVKLIVSVSPIYVKYPAYNKSLDIAAKTCAEKQVAYYDYSKSPEYDRPDYFADPHHLNSAGATLYTKMFIGNMQSVLNGKPVAMR